MFAVNTGRANTRSVLAARWIASSPPLVHSREFDAVPASEACGATGATGGPAACAEGLRGGLADPGTRPEGAAEQDAAAAAAQRPAASRPVPGPFRSGRPPLEEAEGRPVRAPAEGDAAHRSGGAARSGTRHRLLRHATCAAEPPEKGREGRPPQTLRSRSPLRAIASVASDSSNSRCTEGHRAPLGHPEARDAWRLHYAPHTPHTSLFARIPKPQPIPLRPATMIAFYSI